MSVKKREREKRKIKKKRRDIHNHSINHWCLTHLSGIYRRVIWLSKGYFDSSWLLLLWVGFSLNFLHLIHISHISRRVVLPLPSHKIILPLTLKSNLILKVHGWYVLKIKTKDENGINLMFPGIQHPFQEIFFRCFSDWTCIHMWHS